MAVAVYCAFQESGFLLWSSLCNFLDADEIQHGILTSQVVFAIPAQARIQIKQPVFATRIVGGENFVCV